MIQAIKFLTFIGLIVIYMIHSFILSLLCKDLWTFRRKIISVVSAYSRIGLKLAGIKVQVIGQPGDMKFIVANHLSYLDILVLSSQFPTTFVTSMEIRETAGLGKITELAGCLYVERRNKSNLSNEIKEITEALMTGLPVTIFPEATSTNADSVLRFRRPLFKASEDSKVSVSPVCLNYTKIDGTDFNIMNRDIVCWYGDASFLPHLWALMGKREIHVELKLLKDIAFAEPATLAEQSHIEVSQNFNGLGSMSPAAH